jgi:hypothetical protein
LYLPLLKNHTIQIYGGVEEQLHATKPSNINVEIGKVFVLAALSLRRRPPGSTAWEAGKRGADLGAPQQGNIST